MRLNNTQHLLFFKYTFLTLYKVKIRPLIRTSGPEESSHLSDNEKNIKNFTNQ